jgi:hypothetical protein
MGTPPGLTIWRACVLKEIAMHNRIPSRRRQGASPGKGPAGQGNTVPVQGQNATQDRAAPRIPHERDESADSQVTSEPSAQRMAQAAREDIERGVVDTDKGPVLDETYEKLREDTPDPVKKFSP